MKIYSVTFTAGVRGTTRVLWSNFTSANQSYAYWKRHAGDDVKLEATHVPDDAWKPVDKRTEAQLSQVQHLWEQLVASDPDGLDSLLDELVKRVSPPAKEPKPLLTDHERTEAMRALDQLVS